MSFSRNLIPSDYKTGDPLYEDLLGIGFKLSGDRFNKDPNIENTLVAASVEGIHNRAARVIPLLTSWIEMHFERVNTDRLFQLLKNLKPPFNRVQTYWCAMAQRFPNDQRSSVRRMRAIYKGDRRNYPALIANEPNSSKDGTDLLITKNGEDKRFQGTCLRVPNHWIRDRPKDVMPPSELSRFHIPYKFRILMGATYRADMWAALRKNPDLSIVEIARFSYGSYPTAKKAKEDYEIVKRDYSDRKRA